MMQHSLSSIYVTSLRQPELPSEVKLPNLQIFLVATFKDALLVMPNHREALEEIKAQLKGLEDKPYHEHLVCDPENVAFLVNNPVSYTHLRAHETGRNLVCRLLL